MGGGGTLLFRGASYVITYTWCLLSYHLISKESTNANKQTNKPTGIGLVIIRYTPTPFVRPDINSYGCLFSRFASRLKIYSIILKKKIREYSRAFSIFQLLATNTC